MGSEIANGLASGFKSWAASPFGGDVSVRVGDKRSFKMHVAQIESSAEPLTRRTQGGEAKYKWIREDPCRVYQFLAAPANKLTLNR